MSETRGVNEVPGRDEKTTESGEIAWLRFLSVSSSWASMRDGSARVPTSTLARIRIRQDRFYQNRNLRAHDETIVGSAPPGAINSRREPVRAASMSSLSLGLTQNDPGMAARRQETVRFSPSPTLMPATRPAGSQA
jgi:hypothetical protein